MIAAGQNHLPATAQHHDRGIPGHGAAAFSAVIWMTTRAELAGADWLMHGGYDRDGRLVAVTISPIKVSFAEVQALDRHRWHGDYLSATAGLNRPEMRDAARWALACRAKRVSQAKREGLA